jgi:predicted DNA-binding transcriptional regulator YafY
VTPPRVTLYSAFRIPQSDWGVAVPRNTQSTRQIHILRQLERSLGMTLEELAATLPDDYPKNLRTLRRDLDALETAHIPIVKERVDGRTRWRLMDGFRNVPALCFAPTELMALTFSRGLLKPLEGTELHESLQSALNKAASALPPPGLD